VSMDAPYDTLIEFAKEHPDSNLGKAVRSAQSQARDEALEEAAVCLDNYSSPTDVGEEMAHMFARRVRALKASKS
jgi:hypothetical protein